VQRGGSAEATLNEGVQCSDIRNPHLAAGLLLERDEPVARLPREGAGGGFQRRAQSTQLRRKSAARASAGKQARPADRAGATSPGSSPRAAP